MVAFRRLGTDDLIGPKASLFGGEFERIRLQRGVSRRALGERIGCDASMLTRCAHGTRNPSRDMVNLIADGLGCTVEERRTLLRAAGFNAEHLSVVGETEAIDHPTHYGGDAVYETINVIEAWDLGFHLGNVVKYVSRAGKKLGTDGLDDLRKARWYLDREIAQMAREDRP
jgi:transcriptional regulator with XRE-family HTH domain